MTNYSIDTDGNLVVVESVEQTTTHTREDLQRNKEMAEAQKASAETEIAKTTELLLECDRLGII